VLFFGNQLEQLALLAARHRVSASYQIREFASAGGMRYGINETVSIVRPVSMSAVSSRAKSRATCRSNSQPSSSWRQSASRKNERPRGSRRANVARRQCDRI